MDAGENCLPIRWEEKVPVANCRWLSRSCNEDRVLIPGRNLDLARLLGSRVSEATRNARLNGSNTEGFSEHRRG